MTSLAVNLLIRDSTWLPALFAVGENIDRTFNLNHTYVLLGFLSGCIIIYYFTCGVTNPKGELEIQIVLQVPHPYAPDSFPEYDCHISYAYTHFCPSWSETSYVQRFPTIKPGYKSGG